MPNIDTMSRPLTPARVGDPAPEAGIWEHVARTVAWLDAVRGRSPDETGGRVMKIAAKADETVAAYTGVTNGSPRTAVTAATGDLADELCEVVLAALVALVTVTGGTPQAESQLTRHIATRAIRLRALPPAA